MPKAIEGVDWLKIQLEYQKGVGNCRELAELHGLPIKAIQQRCWREKWTQESKLVGEMVSKKVVERLVDEKFERIKAHHSLVIPIAEKLIKGVEKTHDDMNGQALEPSELQGLAMTLKTANSVALLNLGFVEQKAIDVTTNGESLGARALQMMDACRKLKEQGKLPDPSTIDIEGLIREGEEERKGLENGGE